MLSSFLFLLLNNVDARFRCSDSEFSSSSFSCSSESDCIQELGACGEKNKQRCPGLRELPPMVGCDGKCPKINSCKPYTEFDNIVEFAVSIPNSKKLLPLYIQNDVQALMKYASNCRNAENYDAYNAFYYNADSHSGIFDLKFDINFIKYFVRRFYYYLDLVTRVPSISTSGDAIVETATGKTFSLLCPPELYKDLEFTSDADVTNVFNNIIGNSFISQSVVDFIRILSKEICKSVSKCPKKCEFNTYSLYVTLLQKYLCATKKIVEVNTTYNESYGESRLSALYIYQPYERTAAYIAANPTANPTQAFLAPVVDFEQYASPQTSLALSNLNQVKTEEKKLNPGLRLGQLRTTQ